MSTLPKDVKITLDDVARAVDLTRNQTKELASYLETLPDEGEREAVRRRIATIMSCAMDVFCESSSKEREMITRFIRQVYELGEEVERRNK